MKKITGLPILAVLMWPLGLFAADSDTETGQLQEVVVTAEKRSEDIDKVPISLAVFDRSLMDERGIQDMSDIAAITPGVDYINTGGMNRIDIRGISTGGAGTGYATTQVYIDDVPIQTNSTQFVNLYGASEPRVFDLDRVEVLRGPQGTLYGAGAESGAIRFITPSPSLTDYSMYARGGVGTTDGGAASYEAGAAFGGPIVPDELGFRVSAWHREDGGYIQYNSVFADGLHEGNGNFQVSNVVRAALTFAPTGSLQITPSFFYQDVYINNASSFEPADSAAYNDFFTQQWSKLGPQYSNVKNGYFVNQNTVLTPDDDVFTVPALKAVLNLDAVAITSSTSYFHRESSSVADYTTSTPQFFGVPGWPTDPAAAVGDRSFYYTSQNVFAQEVRVQSVDSNQPLQWTVGAWYSRERQFVNNPIVSPYLPTAVFNYYGKTLEQLVGTGQGLLQPGNLSGITDERLDDEQTAGFAQVTYRIVKQWSVIAGVRVSGESVNDYSFENGVDNGGFLTAFTGEQSEHVVDPKFGVNYQLDDDNLLYVSAAKGNRLGGINFPLFGATASECHTELEALGLANGYSQFKGDSLWSYELGSKNRLFDGHLSIEASAFYIDWNNVQFAIGAPACEGSVTTNLAKGISRGFDLQINALITPAFQAGLSMGYTNATVDGTVDVGSLLKPPAVTGDQLNPYAAPWIISPTAQYTFTWATGYKGYVRLDDVYHGRNPGPFAADNPNTTSYAPAPFNFYPNPAYNQLNAHIGTTWDGWDVSVYTLNLLDSHPVLYYNAQSPYQVLGAAYTIRPLTIGLTAAYHW